MPLTLDQAKALGENLSPFLITWATVTAEGLKSFISDKEEIIYRQQLEADRATSDNISSLLDKWISQGKLDQNKKTEVLESFNKLQTMPTIAPISTSRSV